ncbi:transient receptor potential cation channel subfamily M member-like 2 [Diadema setosum]|uniref:transient receptor potential cation channel subfamily M member-like 2 n=1 Tax=Diadema setosum TaxID=31175 RepID=UPI003B3A5532
MTLANTYPDAESVCIQRSIHGTNRSSLRRHDSETDSGPSSSSYQTLRKRSLNLNRNDSSWGHVSAVSKATHFVVDMMDSRRSSWATSNLKKKECIRYVCNPKAPKECCCGRIPSQHCSDADLGPAGAGVAQPAWDAGRDTREYPTDANGQLYFRETSSHPRMVKYVRVSDNTDPKTVITVLTKYWKLKVPQLVISVRGGKKNFKLNSQDQATFNRGLIKATRTIAVWLISGGTNVGVTQAVGNAIREARAMSKISKEAYPKVSLIGIPPWAYVAGTDRLINEPNEELRTVSYKVDPVDRRGQPSPLNPDHTHYILVDDGRKNRYGGNADLKAKLEECIGMPTSEGGLGVPVVSIIVEGGTDSIHSVLNSVRHGTPVVLCNGTGRAADLLSYATRHAEMRGGVRQLTEACLPFLREKAHVLLDIPVDGQEMDEILLAINDCMADENLLTVFEMQKGEHTDLDLAILTALLKLQAVTPINQLSLALSWNRVDVAESRIFTDDVSLPPSALHPFITEALVSDQVDFLRLFIERGAIIKDYLTVARLRRLYNSAPDSCFLRTLLDDVLGRKPGQPIFLHDIGILIKYLTGAHHEPLYTNDQHYRHLNRETRALIILSTSLSGMNLLHLAQEEYVHSLKHGRSLTTGASHLSVMELANPGMHFHNPFRELFIWAVLMDRLEMGAFLWELVDDPVSSAVAASSMLDSMASRVLHLSITTGNYAEHARKYEQLAIGVIDQCHTTHDELAQKLISFPQTRWGDKSILEMAAETKDMNFISHPCCQGLITDAWMGGLRSQDRLIFLTLFFPILIPFLIQFKEEEELQTRCCPIFHKIRIYFEAPVTTFYRHLVAFVCFLFFFSAFNLFFIRPEVSYIEMALFGWICTIAAQEFREMIAPDGMAQDHKLHLWFSSNWNKFDVLLLTIAMLAFGLHWYPPAYEACRALYAIDCMLFYVRTLRLYSASTHLGPKLVMIWKMMMQMMVFLFILLVFLIGYGVASQSLLYPNQDVSWFAIRNAFFVPYFQIYGELFLTAIEHGHLENCDVEGHDPCPTKNMVVLFLLAIYLLIGNVLLLNLLIAIFSQVFEEVQENSMVIWRYEYYFLVIEFKDKPWLPPPFIIIVHMFEVTRWLFRLCMRRCLDRSRVKGTAKAKLEERDLQIFERECAAQYRRCKADEENEDMDQRISRVEERLTELGEMMTKHMETAGGEHRAHSPHRSKQSNLSQQLHSTSLSRQNSSDAPSAPPATQTQGAPTSARVESDAGIRPPKSQFNGGLQNITSSSSGKAGRDHADANAIRFVQEQNALNRHHYAPPIEADWNCSAENRPAGQSVVPSLSHMHSLLGIEHQGDSQNYILEHRIVEGPRYEEPNSVRPPPEGGAVPQSGHAHQTKRSKKRRKKKVAPQEPSAASPRGSAGRSPQSPAAPAPVPGSSFPIWYQRSAFPPIAEQVEEEEEEEEKQT